MSIVNENRCDWKIVRGNAVGVYFETSCINDVYLQDEEALLDNGKFKYCFFCGKRINLLTGREED